MVQLDMSISPVFLGSWAGAFGAVGARAGGWGIWSAPGTLLFATAV